MEEYTKIIEPTYEINESTVKDLAKLLVTFQFISTPYKEFKGKYDYSTIQECVRLYMILRRKHTCFPVFNHIGKVKSHIGKFLWESGVQYPNPIYKIFPPPFGEGNLNFIQAAMAFLNSLEMPKCDWESALMSIDKLKDKKFKKDLTELVEHAAAGAMKIVKSEMYEELRLSSKK